VRAQEDETILQIGFPKLWLRKGFGFAGAWMVREQN